MSKNEFSKIFGLAHKHKWLINKTDQLTELLYDDCKNSTEQNFLADLLDRFTFVDSEEVGTYLNELVLEIVTTPEISSNNTIVAAMAADSNPDSSQTLVQQIKVKLQQQGWNDVAIVNTFGTAYKKSKETEFARTNVILVDEFVGSGKTALSRVKEIKRQFLNANQHVNVLVKTVFSSIVGRNYLLDNGLNFTSVSTIRRGISDFDAGEELSSRIKLMLDLEQRLSPTVGKHLLADCSLGYGKTESLFTIGDQNIPNNVFPIFWWPKRVDQATRKPLFTRWLGD